MAITDYNSLQAEVADWLNRDDLTSKIPTFIQLAEISFKTDLRLRLMETTTLLDLKLGQTDYPISVNLPRFLQMRSVIVQSNPKVILEYLTPEVQNEVWANDPAGQPRSYTLLGDNLRVAPAPNSVYRDADMLVTYFQAVQPLSTGFPVNKLLAEHPNIYLYGTLLQAEPFIQDDSRLTVWQNFYVDAVRRAMVSDGRGTVQGNPLERSESA